MKEEIRRLSDQLGFEARFLDLPGIDPRDGRMVECELTQKVDPTVLIGFGYGGTAAECRAFLHGWRLATIKPQSRG